MSHHVMKIRRMVKRANYKRMIATMKADIMGKLKNFSDENINKIAD